MTERTFAVITGGGTAGHVLPALAVAEALTELGHDAATIHYVGAARGIETRLVPPMGFPHTFLDVVGLQRSVSRRNLAVVPKLAAATAEARQLLRRLRPRVAVSVGGYASMPSVLAAWRLGIPIVNVSFDRVPGRASALTARLAAVTAVPFHGSKLRRAVVTGAPVRRAIRDVDRAAGRDDTRAQLGYPTDRFLVAVIGGSQGSGALNAAVVAYVAAHRDDAALAVHHVAGERFAAEIGAVGSPAGKGAIHRVLGYEPRMDLVYAAADLLVGRGGASTVAEVAVTGVPAVLVPWAASAEDHQTANVRWLSDAGGAVLLAERDLGGLGAVVEGLRADPARLTALSERARTAGEVHRSGALGALIERLAGTGTLPDDAADGQ